MRHGFANVATYTLTVLLIVGAALFGWARSHQLTLSNETTELAQFDLSPGAAFQWEQLGHAVYQRNCANCHLADGAGWDQYPGLGHTASLFAAPSGRDYVIDLHLFGLTSDRWRAPMPPMGHIPDVAMAAVLNHLLTSYGNELRLPQDAQLYIPSDIAARRPAGLSPSEVNRRRPDGIPAPRR
jgi:mono/diheme cytochrome c family protein